MICLGWSAEAFGLRVQPPMESCETQREIRSVYPAVIAVTEQQEGGQRGRVATGDGDCTYRITEKRQVREEGGMEGLAIRTHMVSGLGEEESGKHRVGDFWSGHGLVVPLREG